MATPTYIDRSPEFERLIGKVKSSLVRYGRITRQGAMPTVDNSPTKEDLRIKDLLVEGYQWSPRGISYSLAELAGIHSGGQIGVLEQRLIEPNEELQPALGVIAYVTGTGRTYAYATFDLNGNGLDSKTTIDYELPRLDGEQITKRNPITIDGFIEKVYTARGRSLSDIKPNSSRTLHIRKSQPVQP